MWEATDRENASVIISGPGLEKEIAAHETGPRKRLFIARLSGLETASNYQYTVRSGALTAGPFSFRTAPPPGAGFRMVVYGDTRNAPASHLKVIKGIIASKPEFVIHTGDYLNHGDDTRAWNRDFFEPAAELIKSTPVFPAHGNHEEYAKEYFGYFSTPPGGRPLCDSGTAAQWYTFKWGCARIIVLDSCDDTHDEQWDFFREAAAKKDYSWLFVAMHHPPYSSGNYRAQLAKYEKLVPMFEEAGVDMLFCGHDHNYERLDKDGLPVIIAGGGGAHPYDIHKLGVPHKYSKVRHTGLSFVVCDVTPTEVVMKTKRPDGTVIDGITLKKNKLPQ
ncbi:MAG: hypothetical protein E3J72_19595 [Planctomycetota bacterium]|nr:MAG: hypothetical protein E3J72_19595 [Planctomycetota bacterium]